MSESNSSGNSDCQNRDTITTTRSNSMAKSSASIASDDGTSRKSSRRCMFGCTDGSSTLCRFPIHDVQRCQDWVDFFQVSEEHIRNNSLVNLRVCMKHFREKITMINGKVTRHPSSDSVNSNQSSTRGTKRSRHSSTSGWNAADANSNSRASSVHSDCTSDSETKSKHSSNESLKKLPLEMINGGNRKLFVITPSDGNAVPGQKSKMFLILENGDDNDATKKHQKITLIADKSDAQTAEKIEQLLPQLIERIQGGGGGGGGAGGVTVRETKTAKESVMLIDSEDDDDDKSQKAHEIETIQQQESTDELPLKIKRVETLVDDDGKKPAAKSAKTNSVNLSPDFLFLMKMVPKLEALAEPLKAHIKNRIESLLDDPLQDIEIEESSLVADASNGSA